MPVIILERLPLPSLQTYSIFTVLLLSCSLFYAHHIVTSEKRDFSDIHPALQTSRASSFADLTGDNDQSHGDQTWNLTLPYDSYVWNMLYVMTAEVWGVWSLVNLAYCCLILLGKIIQALIFGELRVSEQQHMKDKFWNFVFYKFIFIFGVMNVQTMEEVVLWVAWFSSLGFLHIFTQLSKDRFEYLSFSPTTPKWVHIKLLSLLFLIFASCTGLMVVCVFVGLEAGITIFAFMTAECLLLAIRVLYVCVRYAIHLWDIDLEGIWENRSIYVYYTELMFELAALSIDFGHHVHMLLWGNIFLSMASLVICMQLRYLFYEFQRRIRRHKNYLQVVKNMRERFPMATKDDLVANSDDCAICWERMEGARRLPCGHLFHNSCLRSWLEQDTSCPTCRVSLSDRADPPPGPHPHRHPDLPLDGDREVPPAPAPGANQATTNHFFHFDASRYVSWLPSFSVEVTHTQMMPGVAGRAANVQTSQFDNMARQVQAVFSHMPLSTIIEDLRITHSVDHTIDNILEGVLVPPPSPVPFVNRPEAEAAPEYQQVVLPSNVSSTAAAAIQAEFNSPGAGSTPHSNQETHGAGSSSPHSNKETNLSDDLLYTELTQTVDAISSQDMPSATGSRFSKSPSEREMMLHDRKNSMIEHARRQYLSTHRESHSPLDLSSSSGLTFRGSHDRSHDTELSPSQQQHWRDVELSARENAYRAAQRRLHDRYS